MNNPRVGWPKYKILYPSGNPAPSAPQPIPSPPFEIVFPRGAFARDGEDPATLDLLASGANRTPSNESRIQRVPRIEPPLVALPSEIWEIKDRLANRNRHYCRTGVRARTHADGTLYGLRRPGLREIPCVLSNPGQVGYPASMNTDASLGFLVTTFHAASLAFKSRDASGNLLVSVAGKGKKGH